MMTYKTQKLYKYIRNNPNKKIMIVSFRRSLEQKYYDDLKEDGFMLYSEIKSHQIDYPKIIIQIDSLHELKLYLISIHTYCNVILILNLNFDPL